MLNDTYVSSVISLPSSYSLNLLTTSCAILAKASLGQLGTSLTVLHSFQYFFLIIFSYFANYLAEISLCNYSKRISLFTTLLAPITTSSPIVTPGKITTCPPIHTLLFFLQSKPHHYFHRINNPFIPFLSRS
jgi:hypothetical protein